MARRELGEHRRRSYPFVLRHIQAEFERLQGDGVNATAVRLEGAKAQVLLRGAERDRVVGSKQIPDRRLGVERRDESRIVLAAVKLVRGLVCLVVVDQPDGVLGEL